MKKLFLFIIILLHSFILSGCTNKQGLLDEKYLIVATSPDYAPYEFIDTSKTGIDKYVGADIELMKYIANALNVTLKIEEMAFDACLTAVQTNKVDISISGFSWTPRRDQNYLLSESYFGEGDGAQQILILSSKANEYTQLADLNKSTIRVGAQSGSIQEELVDLYISKASKQLVTDLDMAVSLLLNGTIDALAISEHAAFVRMANNQNLTILDESFDVPNVGNVVVAKKGNEALMIQINDIIREVVTLDLYATWLEEAKTLAAALGEEIND